MKKIYLFLLASTFSFAVNAQIISTVAGNGTSGFSGDGGQATSAQISSPIGIIADATGNFYIADGSNRIRKVAVNGVITTIAGTGPAAYGGDNGLATSAQLNVPAGLGFNSLGDLFIADYQNHRIRKITMSTGIITTVAGNGTLGFSGDGASALLAQISSPTGVCFDASDNMYIADQGNARVRRVDNITGFISTVAGNGNSGHSGDGGQGTAAAVGNVYDVKCDLSGNVIFSEVFNHYIRKLTVSTGIISSICGSGTATFFGDGGPATAANISAPEGITIDGAGNIFIAELNNDRIRKIDAVTTIITTVAGNGMYTASGDGGPATSAGMWPDAVTTSGTDLLIVDLNNRIRRVTNVASPLGMEESSVHISAISLFPNPVGESFSVTGISPGTLVQIVDMNGNIVFSETVNANQPINISSFAQGTYVLVVENKKTKLVKL
ncbi:MAG: T9SS type A sorting domain-containing protein [Bacteroidia bacterium]